MTELSLGLETRQEKTLELLRSVIRIMGSAPVPVKEQAKEKLAKAAEDIKAVCLDLQEAEDELDLLKEEQPKMKAELETLVDFVLDVDRRVRTGRELINYVKEVYEHELRESVLS